MFTSSIESIEEIKKTNEVIQLSYTVMLYKNKKCKVYLVKIKDQIPDNLIKIDSGNINVYTSTVSQFLSKVHNKIYKTKFSIINPRLDDYNDTRIQTQLNFDHLDLILSKPQTLKFYNLTVGDKIILSLYLSKYEKEIKIMHKSQILIKLLAIKYFFIIFKEIIK